MFERLREDIETVFARDPAARTVWEVLFCYPGLHALWLHRLAHLLWRHQLHFLGRLVSHVNRWLTGVEIHPGARIGRRVFIDHGMGVVIGETAEIGDDVLLYQGVVLGGTTSQKTKRHPTIGDNVVIGAGATLLGAITVGANARIGAGSVVIQSVPAGATVVGVPGHIAGPKEPPENNNLRHDRLPDPVLRAISELQSRQIQLEARIRDLERARWAPEPLSPVSEPAAATEQRIWEALREVLDPEVGVNVVDLGLVRAITVRSDQITVNVRLTSPTCPLADYLVEQIQRKARSVVSQSVTVLLLDEPWSWNHFEMPPGQ